MQSKPPLIALDGDEVVLRQIAQAVAPHFQALVTCDPRKFLAWLENVQDVGAVVTEHVLQTASGVDLLKTARTMRPTARRVLMTTYHDLASIVDGLHSGAIESMVQKPFNPAELLRALMPDNIGRAEQRASA